MVPLEDQKRINHGALVICKAVAEECSLELDVILCSIDFFRSGMAPLAVLTLKGEMDDPEARSMAVSALMSRVEERLPILKGRVSLHIPQKSTLTAMPSPSVNKFSADNYLLHDALRTAVHMSLRMALTDVSNAMPWIDAPIMKKQAMVAVPTKPLLQAACDPEAFRTQLNAHVDAFIPQIVTLLDEVSRRALVCDIVRGGLPAPATLFDFYDGLHRIGMEGWSESSRIVAANVFKA